LRNKTEDKHKLQTNKVDNKSLDNSFTQINKTFNNDNNNTSIVKSRKLMFDSKPEPTNSVLTQLPPPKPKRTFAHDLYLELKFKQNNTNSHQNDALYSIPIKKNKSNDMRIGSQLSQSDYNNTTQQLNNQHIYDDCIIDTNCDPSFKSKLQFLRHLPCLNLK
jgi:hypothetical protein